MAMVSLQEDRCPHTLSGNQTLSSPNVDSLPEEFKPDKNGYIGLSGRSGEEDKRQLLVTDASSTYASLSKDLTEGAVVDNGVKVSYGGTSWLHEGGHRITIRPNSKSGSPVIEITSTLQTLASQKIHIEEIK